MELVALLAVATVTAGVIGLAGRFPEARNVKRALARARRHTFASLGDGNVVTVRGSVVPVNPADVLASPVSGKPCVYYRLTFTEHGTELGRAEGTVPFAVVLDDGQIRVDASAPRLGLHGESHVLPLRDFLDLANTDPLIQLARATCKRKPRSALRVSEYVLLPGTQATIQGVCTREPDPLREASDAVYRDGERPTRPVISGTRRSPLMIG